MATVGKNRSFSSPRLVRAISADLAEIVHRKLNRKLRKEDRRNDTVSGTDSHILKLWKEVRSHSLIWLMESFHIQFSLGYITLLTVNWKTADSPKKVPGNRFPIDNINHLFTGFI